MKKFTLPTIVLGCFFLSACNEKVYTVADFTADKSLRDEYTRKCDNGELKGDALMNCDNLFKAKLEVSRPSKNSMGWD